MKTRIAFLWLASSLLAGSNAPALDWDSEDPVTVYRAAAADRQAAKPKKKDKAKKPEVKFDRLRLPRFYDQLLGVSARLAGRVILEPYLGTPDASQGSSLRYPVVLIYYIQQPPVPMERPLVFGLYVIGEDELQRGGQSPDGSLPSNRLVGFAVDGVRYLYLLTSDKPEERALAEKYYDEMDGVIEDGEVLRLQAMDWQAKSQFDFWLDQHFGSERRSAEQAARARENPWWKKLGLDQETVDRMLTRYEFKLLRDVDGHSPAELVFYTSDPETLDERGQWKRAEEPSHKWNTLYVGLEIQDGHKEHSDRIHLDHSGKTYCSRAPVGGFWHEPFTSGHGSKVILATGLPAGQPGPRALLLVDKDGASKAIFAVSTLYGPPHRMVRAEVRDLDAAATAALLASAESVEDLATHARRAEVKPPLLRYGRGVAALSPRDR